MLTRRTLGDDRAGLEHTKQTKMHGENIDCGGEKVEMGSAAECKE
jgi:hypothetical protein